MSDFRIEVEAQLNTSNLESQLNSLKGQKIEIPVELKVNDSAISKLTSSLNSIGNKGKVNVDTSGLVKAESQAKEMSAVLKQLSNFEVKIRVDDFGTKLNSMKNTIAEMQNALKDSTNTEMVSQLNAIQTSYDSLVSQAKEFRTEMSEGVEIDPSSIDQFSTQLQQTQNQVKNLKSDLGELVTPLQQINLSNQIQSWLENNTKATKDAKEQLQEYVNTLNNMGDMSKGDFNQIQTGFKQITQQQAAAGNTGKSFLSQFEQSFARIGQFTGIYRITSQIPRLFSDMFSNVVDVNSALIELRKVSDATDVELSDSFEHATESAKEYGAAISEVINSQADWARLGYSVQESEQLADVTTLLQAVGDNMTQESSTEGLISVLRGFQYDASQAQDIVDIVNEVANNEPIDTSGLFDALERCSSSLYAANNTLEESVALVTTANSVVQNPESVGTTFKTMSMRIRGAKTELEEAGLETDGMAESTSKLREEILALSGVDIMIDDSTFKSTYDIVLELAEVWDTLTDVSQANISELLAGEHVARIYRNIY